MLPLHAESLISFPDPYGSEREVVELEDAARIMGRSVAEVRRLAEIGWLYARREDGVVKVEPAIINRVSQGLR
jgi:hypothetical protein